MLDLIVSVPDHCLSFYYTVYTCSRFVRLEVVVSIFIGFLLLSCTLRNNFTTECYHKIADTMSVLCRDLARSCMIKKL